MTGRHLLRLALCAGLALGLPALSSAGPRAISEAERSAVQIMTGYLSRGPSAVVERLASGSPLRRLPAATLADEIETRLGPPAGARWELQTVVPALKDRVAAFSISYPSGVDESVTVEMVQEADGWKVRDLRILAQPSLYAQPFAGVRSAAPGQAGKPLRNEWPLACAFFAAVLAISAAYLRLSKRAVAFGMLAGAAALLLAPLVMRVSGSAEPRKNAVAAAAEEDDGRLASLLETRRQLAGRGEQVPKPLAGCRGRTCRDVAALWSAQANIQQMKLKEAKAALAQFPSPSRFPLAEILRGRIALLELDETSAAVAYEHAVSLGPGRDGLWCEAAEALGSLGYDDRAEKYFRRLDRVGSRDADVYYILSFYSAMRGNGAADALTRLQEAWQLKPVERASIVSAAPLWAAIRKTNSLQFISLSATSEPAFASAQASSRAIALPPEALPRISGDLLDIRIGEGEMLVPGGSALAPAGTAVTDAGAWARLEEEHGLADVPRLKSVASTPAALAQPALRLRFTRAARALAARNRWNELEELTRGLTPKAEYLPPELFFLRNDALEKCGRSPDAKLLMAQLAASRVLQRRQDAESLERLAEALAAHDLFDPAVAMYDRAQAIRSNPYTDDRVRQIQTNKRLATKYSVFTSEHFEIHYPDDVSDIAAGQIAKIMEDEFTRLKKWVPLREFRRTVVNVVWWQDFRSTYTGNDFILGFYDGKLTVPFAGVQVYVPEAVALLTHELCHAMVGQATKHQAPRWFQEGLAVRVEMVPYHANAFNMYDDERLIAVPLLDAVLGGSPDPEMVGGAYIQAQTVIRFIESEFGVQAISKMIEQFQAGANTEEAIMAATHLTIPQFDTKLRAWGRSGARVFENPPPKRYDLVESGSRFAGGAR